MINAQEFFGARDKKPIATCLEEVEKSDVVIMFLGPRYGAIEPDTGKSYVECEYDYAVKGKKPILAYMIDESFSFPISYVSIGEDAVKLRGLKERVKRSLTVEFFTTPDDLAKKVYADLKRELPKWGFSIGQASIGDKDQSAIAILQRFKTLPKLYYGQAIKLRVKFGDYARASENACHAFSYRYGAALTREFSVHDPELAKFLVYDFGKIYADEKNALLLIEAQPNVEYDVILKTIQGTYTSKNPIYGSAPDPDPWEISSTLSLTGIDRPRRIIVGYEDGDPVLMRGLELVELSRTQLSSS